jgi:hypothetical protein
MTQTLKELLRVTETWPQADQDELADHLREIGARRTGVYRLNDDEWAGVQDGLRQADNREYVSDAVVKAADKRHSG